jgi:hypothetical protein
MATAGYECPGSPNGMHHWENVTPIGATVEQRLCAYCRGVPLVPGVAYMPVPRCDQCQFWYRAGDAPKDVGRCECEFTHTQESGIMHTLASFGCVQFEAK